MIHHILLSLHKTVIITQFMRFYCAAYYVVICIFSYSCPLGKIYHTLFKRSLTFM